MDSWVASALSLSSESLSSLEPSGFRLSMLQLKVALKSTRHLWPCERAEGEEGFLNVGSPMEAEGSPFLRRVLGSLCSIGRELLAQSGAEGCGPTMWKPWIKCVSEFVRAKGAASDRDFHTDRANYIVGSGASFSFSAFRKIHRRSGKWGDAIRGLYLNRMCRMMDGRFLKRYNGHEASGQRADLIELVREVENDT